jgi:hypothetical protein
MRSEYACVLLAVRKERKDFEEGLESLLQK